MKHLTNKFRKMLKYKSVTQSKQRITKTGKTHSGLLLPLFLSSVTHSNHLQHQHQLQRKKIDSFNNKTPKALKLQPFASVLAHALWGQVHRAGQIRICSTTKMVSCFSIAILFLLDFFYFFLFFIFLFPLICNSFGFLCLKEIGLKSQCLQGNIKNKAHVTFIFVTFQKPLCFS